MEVEKRGSKGGFLHFFDWNSKSKSRKKLFSSKSDLNEGTRKGNDRIDKLVAVVDEVDDSGVGMKCRAGCDSNHASSVSSDEGYGTKAPGVVARLMGLDSLPSFSVNEPHSLCLGATRESHYSKTSLGLMNDYQIIDYDCMPKEFEVLSRYPVKTRSHKLRTRPIERFQSEVLPPKSAKSIPTTHHKLLSPIKSPGFIPKKRAAYIMEAATKFIESGPQAAVSGKNPTFGSSSVPMRFQDLKQKMEAAQKVPRPEKHKEPGSVRNMKVQNKRWNGSQDMQMLKSCANSENVGAERSKNNGRAISLALQAKVNVQKRDELIPSNKRREGPTSGSNRNSTAQKEHAVASSNHASKRQSGLQNSAQKRNTTKKISSVLRQNNQKQNCASSKDRFPTGTSGPCQQVKSPMSVNGSSGPRKTINTVVVESYSGSGKLGSARTAVEKEISSSKTKVSQKKHPVNQDNHFEKSVDDNLYSDQDVNPLKYHAASDGSTCQEVDSRKKCMDVVSFTFTSPIKRSVETPQFSSQEMEQNDCSFVESYGGNNYPDSKNSKTPTPGLNIISGDALSVLLDQKLRELRSKVEKCNLVEAGAATKGASIVQDTVSSFNVVRSIAVEPQGRVQLSLQGNNSNSLVDVDSFSTDGLMLKVERKQQVYGMEEHCSSSDSRKGEKSLMSQHHAPLLELSSSTESCISSDSRNTVTDNNSGTTNFSSTQSQQTSSCLFTRNTSGMGGETELSDSASSMWDAGGSNTTSMYTRIDDPTSIYWELVYVRNIVCSAELCKEFAAGETPSVLKPCIFDQLENQKEGLEESEAEYARLERKVLFECVTECLDSRSQRFSGGGCKAWAKWVTLFERKGWLAEELYKEILGWRGMAEEMVDSLVDKDMSTAYGRWVDFEIEAFEEGVQIENDIVSCLVDELVDDFFFS